MAIQPVGIITTDYTDITNGADKKQYVLDRIAQGTGSTIYVAPNIPAAVYTAGNGVATAIGTAVTNHGLVNTPANARIIKDKVALADEWLDSLVALVIPIANAPANASTREEAATNIVIIGFTPEKLTQASKGAPEKAVFTATYEGGGTIALDITNGVDFDPATMTVVAIGVPPVTTPPTPAPVITLTGAQLLVTSKVSVPVLTKTFSGRGKGAKLEGMDFYPNWIIVIFSQNGNKQISLISAAVPVNLFTPPS